MDQSMHYYGIGYLARAAGIPKEKALKIAYASQYVDDSTESVPIRFEGGSFDTVRTAHLGPEAWTNGVHKNVYVPFHFIPEKPITKLGDSYVTKPDSIFSKMLLDRAFEEENEADRLIALGIALHTYADTFAHQGFTGRDDDVNQLSSVASYDGKKWKSADFSNAIGEVVKGVGHLLAGGFPDSPWLRWRCKHKGIQSIDERDNKQIFMKAAKAIYGYLRNTPVATESGRPWNTISKKIKDVISNEDDDVVWRIYGWIELYGDTFRVNGKRDIQGYRYDKLSWRRSAVDAVGNLTVAWDDMERWELENQKYKPKPGFMSSDWVRFHNMALKHRHFVQQRTL